MSYHIRPFNLNAAFQWLRRCIMAAICLQYLCKYVCQCVCLSVSVNIKYNVVYENILGKSTSDKALSFEVILSLC